MRSRLQSDPLYRESRCSILGEPTSHHSDLVKQNLISQLNRIEVQIQTIKKLIERETYCDEVIIQIAATQAALNEVKKFLVEGHIRNGVLKRIHDGDLKVVDEILLTVQRLVKK